MELFHLRSHLHKSNWSSSCDFSVYRSSVGLRAIAIRDNRWRKTANRASVYDISINRKCALKYCSRIDESCHLIPIGIHSRLLCDGRQTLGDKSLDLTIENRFRRHKQLNSMFTFAKTNATFYFFTSTLAKGQKWCERASAMSKWAIFQWNLKLTIVKLRCRWLRKHAIALVLERGEKFTAQDFLIVAIANVIQLIVVCWCIDENDNFFRIWNMDFCKMPMTSSFNHPSIERPIVMRALFPTSNISNASNDSQLNGRK